MFDDRDENSLDDIMDDDDLSENIEEFDLDAEIDSDASADFDAAPQASSEETPAMREPSRKSNVGSDKLKSLALPLAIGIGIVGFAGFKLFELFKPEAADTTPTTLPTFARNQNSQPQQEPQKKQSPKTQSTAAPSDKEPAQETEKSIHLPVPNATSESSPTNMVAPTSNENPAPSAIEQSTAPGESSQIANVLAPTFDPNVLPPSLPSPEMPKEATATTNMLPPPPVQESAPAPTISSVPVAAKPNEPKTTQQPLNQPLKGIAGPQILSELNGLKDTQSKYDERLHLIEATNIELNNKLSLSYERLQKLQASVEDLQKTISDLRNEIAELQKTNTSIQADLGYIQDRSKAKPMTSSNNIAKTTAPVTLPPSMHLPELPPPPATTTAKVAPPAPAPVKETPQTSAHVTQASPEVNLLWQQEYSVEALIPGRAWLKTQEGSTITVTEGETLGKFGKIIAIDADNGAIVTSSGITLRN